MKVHFAGHEDVGMSKPLKKAGVKYVLGSFYQIRKYKDQHAIDFVKCLNSYTHYYRLRSIYINVWSKKSYCTNRTNDY